jgi:mRNA-degrading endonuclease toxin of MazEF toxin-antitoxin module
VVVNVPFSTQQGSKRRPAVVVSVAAFHHTLHDVLLCPISSQPRHVHRPGPGDVPLDSWRTVGLRYPSAVRISNLLATDKTLIERVLGALSQSDLRRVLDGLRIAFNV